MTLQDLLPPLLSRDLSRAESEVLDKAQNGGVADFGVDDPIIDGPTKAGLWGGDRTVRSELLEWLCSNTAAADLTHPKGVRIVGAKFSTVLDLEACTIRYPIALKNCSIPDGLILCDARMRSLSLDKSSLGHTDLRNAIITGNLSCKESVFASDSRPIDGENRMLFLANGLTVEGSVFFDGMRTNGTVSLIGARITRELSCKKASLEGPSLAFAADGVRIGGDFFLNNTCTKGAIRLVGIRIGGQLIVNDATIDAPSYEPDKPAFAADGATIEGGCSLDKSKITGATRFVGAKIGGQLSCESATLRSCGVPALNADGVQVDGRLCLNGVKTRGEIRLVGARISGDVSCRSAELRGNLIAFNANSATIGNLFFNNTETDGAVDLIGARINGELNCLCAKLSTSGKKLFDMRHAKVRDALVWQKIRLGSRGFVDFSHSAVGELDDDESSWPHPGDLLIEGFEYVSFGKDSPKTAATRLKWIDLAPLTPFRQQPYVYLAYVLRGIGLISDARHILFEKQEALRKRGQMTRIGRFWNRLLGVTYGHGYKPWKVSCFIGFSILVGWLVFTLADCAGIIRPSRELVHIALEQKLIAQIPKDYPHFSPLVYSIDTFFPFVDLHQETYFLPIGEGWYAFFAHLYLWLHIGFGWVLSSLAIAPLKRFFEEDDWEKSTA